MGATFEVVDFFNDDRVCSLLTYHALWKLFFFILLAYQKVEAWWILEKPSRIFVEVLHRNHFSLYMIMMKLSTLQIHSEECRIQALPGEES